MRKVGKVRGRWVCISLYYYCYYCCPVRKGPVNVKSVSQATLENAAANKEDEAKKVSRAE